MAKLIRHIKLVRDRIPEQLRARGIEVRGRKVLSMYEKTTLAIHKLHEEVGELDAATTDAERVEELCDIYTIIEAYEMLYGLDHTRVVAKQWEKANTKGRFNDWWYLESTEEPE